MTCKVSERGQITINREVRQKLKIQPGMVAHQRVVDGHLEIVFLPEPHHRSLYGVLHREGEEPMVVTSEQLDDAVMEALDEELGQVADNRAR